MKRKLFLLICLGGIALFAILKYVERNAQKQIVFAVYNVPKFERSQVEGFVQDFMRENPGVTVKLKEFKRSYSDLKAGINDPKEPIDLFMLSYPLVAAFAKNDLILPLTEYNGVKKSKDGSSWEAFAYPRNTRPHALIFNKEFFKDSNKSRPKSQKDLEAIFEDFQAAGVQYPFLVDTELEEYLSDPVLSEYVVEAMGRGQLDYLNSLLEKKLMILTSATGEDNRYEVFLKKKAGAIISTDHGIQYIENSDPFFKFNVISLLLDEGDSNDKVLFYNRYVIGKNSKNPDLVFKFIEFLNIVNDGFHRFASGI